MRRALTGLAAAIMVLSATATVPVLAEEPEPTPSPTPKTGKDLSSVAGEITLNKDVVGKDGGIVISNENLPELAGKGRVTEVTKPGAQDGRRMLADSQGPGAGVEGKGEGYAETAERKRYWQTMYTQQLKAINDIATQIDVLDYEIPGLWRDFYSWDDPAYRDGVIKPRLDKALAQREQLEIDLQAGKGKLDEIKESARREGAEPGWFRGLGEVPAPKPTEGVLP